MLPHDLSDVPQPRVIPLVIGTAGLRAARKLSGSLRMQEMILCAAADRLGVGQGEALAAYYGFDESATPLVRFCDLDSAEDDEHVLDAVRQDWILDVHARAHASAWLCGEAQRTPEQLQLWRRLERELPDTRAHVVDDDYLDGRWLAWRIKHGPFVRPPLRRRNVSSSIHLPPRRPRRRERRRCRSPGRPEDDPDPLDPESAA